MLIDKMIEADDKWIEKFFKKDFVKGLRIINEQGTDKEIADYCENPREYLFKGHKIYGKF